MTGIKKWWKWAYARQVEYKSISLKSSYDDDAENDNYLASPFPRSNSTKKEQLDAVLVEELAGG